MNQPDGLISDNPGLSIISSYNCPHFQITEIGKLIRQKLILSEGSNFFQKKCQICESEQENWICMTCFKIFCSRYVNSHMISHHETEKHNIVLSFIDFQIWCYDCDFYITNPQILSFQQSLLEIRFWKESEIKTITKSIENLTVSKFIKKLKEKINKPKYIIIHCYYFSSSLIQSEKITYENVIEGLKNKVFKNVYFLTGAGISVASGIPDFRSPGTGLYFQLEKYNLPSPQTIFQLQFFKNKPEAFYTLAKEFLLKFKGTPVKAHKFIKKMDEEGLLKLCFTQNIDGLELEAGLDESKLIQAHGHLRTTHCIECNQEEDCEKWLHFVEKEEIMKCNICKGLIKPDVVFFGESLPKRFLQHMASLKNADLVIIMGTSLKVMPFARLPLAIQNKKVPILLINRENSMVGWHMDNQIIFMPGDIEENVQKLCNDLGWQL